MKISSLRSAPTVLWFPAFICPALFEILASGERKRFPPTNFSNFTLASQPERVYEVGSGEDPFKLIGPAGNKTGARLWVDPRLMVTVLAAGLLLLLGLRAPAHTLPISYVFVVTDKDYVHLELSFNPFELASFRDFDVNQNGRLDPEELVVAEVKLTRQILDHLQLSTNGKPVAAETAGLAPDADSHHATLRAHYRVDAARTALALESRLPEITSSSHLSQVNFLRDGKPQLAQLDSQSRQVTFSVATPVAAGSTLPVPGPTRTPASGKSLTVALAAVFACFLLAALRPAKRNPTATPPANPSALNPPPTL